MSIKGYFLLFMGLLTAAALVGAVVVMLVAYGELSSALRSERMMQVFDAILEVPQRASRERGYLNAALLGETGVKERVPRVLRETDSAFDAAIELIERRAGMAAMADEVRQIRRDFLDQRARMLVQIEAGRAAPALNRDYVERMLALMTRLNMVADRVEQIATAGAQPLARSYVEVARLAAIIRDYAGRRASRFNILVGTGARVTPGLALDLGDDAGRVQASWRRLLHVIGVIERMAGGALPSDLRGAIDTMDRAYFHDAEALYRAVIEDHLNGAGTAVSLDDLRARTVVALDTSVAIQRSAMARARAATVDDQVDAWLELAEAAGFLALLVVGATGAFLMLRRRVVAPLEALTHIVVRMADDDRAVAVPELARRDEIGQLARAIETLRANAERAAAVERERQMMETQLRQAQKLESLGTLAGGIAHEINTPTQYVGDNIRFLETCFADIRTVIECADALVAAAETEPALAPLARAQREAETRADLDFLREEIPSAIAQSLDGVERIRQIVLAVKEFSHPDVKEIVPLDLKRAIETTITVSRNQWKYVATLETAFDPELPPVPCRGGEINQVILNLIVNAAHAIEAKGAGMGKITVSTARRDGFAEIRVSDTGTGVPAEIRERIFDPFFTTKAPGKGTGQGLAICHAIVVQKHGGTIAVESTPGEGASFIVHLPLEAVQPDAGLSAAA